MGQLLLAIDQGTTGTQIAFYDATTLQKLAHAKSEFRQIFPSPGLVEHAPADIWASVVQAYTKARGELAQAHASRAHDSVAGIGIANQRETCVAWDARSGDAFCNAIVWQDRRTADACSQLKNNDATRQEILALTGLVCDPYFSGTKMQWMLENVDAVSSAGKRGTLCFGTIDSWLVWRLTGGVSHVTDHTNASRTLLYGLEKGDWNETLLDRFHVPRSALPRIVDSVGLLGTTKGFLDLPDGTPITGALGDQQAALFGQDCERPGEAKITYGTGAFLLMHTGTSPVLYADDGLLSTVACAQNGRRTFAREGAAFIAGAAIQFVRDNLGWIKSSADVEHIAANASRDPGLHFVPALTGLPAPWWNPDARGMLLGLTRGTTKEQIMRAVLESVALQNTELLRLICASAGVSLARVAVDGGASQNDFLMQFQADVLQTPLWRPSDVETTSRGAVKAARLGLGDTTTVPWAKTASWPAQGSHGHTFTPQFSAATAKTTNASWLKAARFVDAFYRESP
ncbi:MAG: glycerol kinase GlpK [Silvanigrellales bacterium]|nr:glycerol kinase GlpK [Silvanigrellales bacterium]